MMATPCVAVASLVYPSNMARIRLTGRPGARRIKVVKEVHLVQQDAYDAAAVAEVDPNVQLVAKLQKGLKLFRDIAGDSDEVGNKCICFVYVSRVAIKRVDLILVYVD